MEWNHSKWVPKYKTNQTKCLCERLGKSGCFQKRDLGACKGTSLLDSGVELPVIFYTKK